MKSLFLMISMVITFTSCGQVSKIKTPGLIHHDIIIMVDNTEGRAYPWSEILRFEDIVKMFTIDGKQAYGSVTFQKLNNVSMNQTVLVTLTDPNDCKDGSTALQRKMKKEDNQKLLSNSFNEISRVYNSFIGDNTPNKIENSMIFKPVCNAIIKLDQSFADIKTLIILSDMIENSDCGNFYKIDCCENVIDRLINCSNVALPNNSKVKVIILFRTNNPKNDQFFSKSIEVWKKMFQSAHINYEVRPNL